MNARRCGDMPPGLHEKHRRETADEGGEAVDDLRAEECRLALGQKRNR